MRIKYNYDFDAVYTYEYNYPNEFELLEIFPEAHEIILQKIDEWTRRKGKLLAKETIPFFKKCNALKDEFSRAFWKETYRYMAGRLNQCLTQLKRLRRLEALLSPAVSNGFADWDKKKALAKEKPITGLYDFQNLRRIGKNWKALCPFHADKVPSFVIYDNNTYHCFGCLKNGDSISFIQNLRDLTFPEAVDYLVGGVL